jgi:hypothetical protein
VVRYDSPGLADLGFELFDTRLVAGRGALVRSFLAQMAKSRISNMNGVGCSFQAVPLLGEKLDCTIDQILIQGLTGFLFLG